MSRCITCGYDLSTLPSGQPCPECGSVRAATWLSGPVLAFARLGLVCLIVGLPAQFIIELQAGLTPPMPSFATSTWLFPATTTLLGSVVLFLISHNRRSLTRGVLLVAILGMFAVAGRIAGMSSIGSAYIFYSASGWIRTLVFGPCVIAIGGLALGSLARAAGEHRLAWIYRSRLAWPCLAIAWMLAIVVAQVAGHQVELNAIARNNPPGPMPPGGFRIPPIPDWVVTLGNITSWCVFLKSLCLVGSVLTLWVESLLLAAILAMRRTADAR